MYRLLQRLLLGCSLFLGGGYAVSQDLPTTCLMRNGGYRTAALICQDAALRAVDAKLFAYINEYHLPEHKIPRVIEAMKMWTDLRDQCKDVECLYRFYKSSVPEWFAFLERLAKEETA